MDQPPFLPWYPVKVESHFAEYASFKEACEAVDTLADMGCFTHAVEPDGTEYYCTQVHRTMTHPVLELHGANTDTDLVKFCMGPLVTE